eukprot:m.7588 g.7588  ORF g.7588 m.7588 type:complete len:996 (+) comp2773_c0_seq1:219-3206(+)
MLQQPVFDIAEVPKGVNNLSVNLWDSARVLTWLHENKFSEFVPAFEQFGFTGDQLLSFSNSGLAKLGKFSDSRRKELLKAVAGLKKRKSKSTGRLWGFGRKSGQSSKSIKHRTGFVPLSDVQAEIQRASLDSTTDEQIAAASAAAAPAIPSSGHSFSAARALLNQLGGRCSIDSQVSCSSEYAEISDSPVDSPLAAAAAAADAMPAAVVTYNDNFHNDEDEENIYSEIDDLRVAVAAASASSRVSTPCSNGAYEAIVPIDLQGIQAQREDEELDDDEWLAMSHDSDASSCLEEVESPYEIADATETEAVYETIGHSTPCSPCPSPKPSKLSASVPSSPRPSPRPRAQTMLPAIPKPQTPPPPPPKPKPRSTLPTALPASFSDSRLSVDDRSARISAPTVSLQPPSPTPMTRARTSLPSPLASSSSPPSSPGAATSSNPRPTPRSPRPQPPEKPVSLSPTRSLIKAFEANTARRVSPPGCRRRRTSADLTPRAPPPPPPVDCASAETSGAGHSHPATNASSLSPSPRASLVAAVRSSLEMSSPGAKSSAAASPEASPRPSHSPVAAAASPSTSPSASPRTRRRTTKPKPTFKPPPPPPTEEHAPSKPPCALQVNLPPAGAADASVAKAPPQLPKPVPRPPPAAQESLPVPQSRPMPPPPPPASTKPSLKAASTNQDQDQDEDDEAVAAAEQPTWQKQRQHSLQTPPPPPPKPRGWSSGASHSTPLELDEPQCVAAEESIYEECIVIKQQLALELGAKPTGFERGESEPLKHSDGNMDKSSNRSSQSSARSESLVASSPIYSCPTRLHFQFEGFGESVVDEEDDEDDEEEPPEPPPRHNALRNGTSSVPTVFLAGFSPDESSTDSDFTDIIQQMLVPVSVSEQLDLQEWYSGPLSRQAAEDILREDPMEGRFLLRESPGLPSQEPELNYTLSFLHKGMIRHVRVVRLAGAVSLFSNPQPCEIFSSIVSMIDFYGSTSLRMGDGSAILLSHPCNLSAC